MLRLVILEPPICDAPDCGRKATRVLEDESGDAIGTYCTVHGNRKLTAERNEAKPKAVKATG